MCVLKMCLAEEKTETMLLEAKPETNIPTSTPVCKTSSQSQLTHEEATTLPHNQTQVINTEECTPVLPNFGWESIPGEKDPIPYIVRDSESYVAWMIYENKILKRFTPILSNMVLAFITADLKQMSEAEAAMFNEINLKHCDGNLAGQDYRFLSEAPMLSLEDVKTSLNFFLTCYNVVCLTKINNDLFGFLKISGENEVAFVWNKNTQLVPLFYFEGQSEYLDSKSINLTDKWQVRYMRFCCMAQGVRQDYYNASPMKVVDFEYVRSLFPENTPVECSWPKDFNQDILGPESKTLLPLTKANQPTNQLLTNSTQSYENSLTPRLGGNNENRIPRPEKHWDQTVNSALPQLTNMMQPVNNQSRMLRPQTANSVQSHVNTQSGLGNNNQSGIKRSVTQNSELKKRLRCEIKSPPLKVTETSNQIASSSSTQQAQTKALHDIAAVTISLMSEKENTAQNTSSTQQKQSASISMSVQTESYVPHYGQNVNSSTTSNFNQTGIRAVQPPNGPLYGPVNRPALPPPYAHNLYRGTSPQLPSYQMQAPTIRYSQRTGAPEYPLSNSGWNGTGHTAYPANIPSTRYPQQNPATYNPAVRRSNNQYRNQNQSPTNSFQISSALYAQISAYFQQNVLSKPKSSPFMLSALTEMFINSCGVSGSELARLSTLRSWIYKTFADMCYKAGYFPHPSPSNIHDRTNSQVQGNTNKVVKTLQCEHVNSGGNYVVKILPLGSQQIYGISLSTVSDKYIVNLGDVVNKFRLMFKDYQSYMSKIEPTTLYELNNAQKQQWDKLVNSGLVCPNPYNFYFIEYQPIILMLTKNNYIH